MTIQGPAFVAGEARTGLRLRRQGRRGKAQNTGKGGCDGSATARQVPGGPIGSQRKKVGQAALGTGEQGAELGYA